MILIISRLEIVLTRQQVARRMRLHHPELLDPAIRERVSSLRFVIPIS